MSLNNDEWAISSRVHKISLRNVPHIYWSYSLKRWQFLHTNGGFYTLRDHDAQEYINMLNVTKQAHPIK